MPTHYGGEFDEVLRSLRKHAPPIYPVRVETVPARKMPKHHEDETPIDGDATAYFLDGVLTHHRIRVSRGLHNAIDVLVHEWAHMLDNEDNGHWVKGDGHRNTWGEIYARLYRIIFE